MRKRLPDVRQSITHKAIIHGDPPVKFFITVGLYDDGAPGEIFITMNDANSDIRGWAICWSIAISLCLQSEVPLEKIVEKFGFQRFEPAGFTDCPEVRNASSIPDYVVRWLESHFAPKSEKEPETGDLPASDPNPDLAGCPTSDATT